MYMKTIQARCSWGGDGGDGVSSHVVHAQSRATLKLIADRCGCQSSLQSRARHESTWGPPSRSENTMTSTPPSFRPQRSNHVESSPRATFVTARCAAPPRRSRHKASKVCPRSPAAAAACAPSRPRQLNIRRGSRRTLSCSHNSRPNKPVAPGGRSHRRTAALPRHHLAVAAACTAFAPCCPRWRALHIPPAPANPQTPHPPPRSPSTLHTPPSSHTPSRRKTPSITPPPHTPLSHRFSHSKTRTPRQTPSPPSSRPSPHKPSSPSHTHQPHTPL